MQAILSRAGQAPRGGCKACSSAINTLGKRPAPVRRKPTFAELFTACYSSMFATAALVDAIRKDDRRRELDRQLDEVRKEIADLQDGRQSPSSDLDSRSRWLALGQMDELWRALKKIYHSRPYMKEIHQPATISKSDLIEALKHEYYGCSSGRLRNAKRQLDYEILESAIMREETDTGRFYRESRNHVQLMRESMNAEALVRKLLERSRFYAKGEPAPSLEKAQTLLKEGSPGFTFRSIDAVRAQENTILLNKRLRALVAASHLNVKEKIGRICYNLLISSHPPDVHTYNTLIVAFNKSGYHSFAEALVASFFHDRLLQPTPSTFIAILNHYQCTNNHGKFLRALACITGIDNRTGAKIRRRHVADINRNPTLVPWALDSKRRTLNGEWIWDHLPLTLPLVEEILSGLLHFKLFDQATTFLMSCMQCGVRLSLDSVKHFFDECIDALDWRAAAELAYGLARSETALQRLLSYRGGDEGPSYVVDRIRVLLDICGLGGPNQVPKSLLTSVRVTGPAYAKLLNALAEEEGLPQGASRTSRLTDRCKSRVLRLESLLKEYEFVRKTTLSIESKLLYPDFSPAFRVSMALYIGGTALQRSEQLSRELTEFRETCTLAKSLPQPPKETEDATEPVADTSTNSESMGFFSYGSFSEGKPTESRLRQALLAWSNPLESEAGVFRRIAVSFKGMTRSG
ncbi:hypothetical protein M440DRAFT_1404872 [Trichoderma longibrachiatum ATCC 18648]|uniref:Pentatricopeptide repeat domain-containing protein n=1 Tax=Trichoderma longibrachiatum ATCC 18648 TaxID=983965 RepID=A0A2T4BUZ5_TRILO|nr:hypothetical protein M440DRAFT_1404872 [Trichoderma longibrachiatum ATCC 18648]